mmetsp:Transcript_29618/g.67069  ORF Transcript_29618/g.67069 Transcript_29618/m.67069 type:complete len:111 (+) Transcript_29618:86-418(+)
MHVRCESGAGTGATYLCTISLLLSLHAGVIQCLEPQRTLEKHKAHAPRAVTAVAVWDVERDTTPIYCHRIKRAIALRVAALSQGLRLLHCAPNGTCEACKLTVAVPQREL